MDNIQLTELLTSNDEKQINQAVIALKQKEGAPEELMTPCFIALQTAEIYDNYYLIKELRQFLKKYEKEEDNDEDDNEG